MEAGVDYELTWANNVGVKNGAVTASMTVTGIRNYTGERAYTFVISDKVVTDAFLTLSTNVTDFTDVALTVPAESLPGGKTRLTIVGDHAAFGYWFYQ